MHTAILTFDGFNELDSFIALGILNRIKRPAWRVAICCPQSTVTSMNGVSVQRQSALAEAASADAVIIGSGTKTRDIVNDLSIISALRLDPSRQLIGAQCSGALILAKLGLLDGISACTDLTTQPWLEDAGVDVVREPFRASGNIATAGGCLASQYLAAWVIARTVGEEAARQALHYVAPVGGRRSMLRGLWRIYSATLIVYELAQSPYGRSTT